METFLELCIGCAVAGCSRVTVILHRPNLPPEHGQGTFFIDRDAFFACETPEQCGIHLGKQLFQGRVAELLIRSLDAASAEPHERSPRLILAIEEETFRDLPWEWLAVPLGPDGSWCLLAATSRILAQRYISSTSARHFFLGGHWRLKMLALFGSPPEQNDYRHLKVDPFDIKPMATSLREVTRGAINCEILGDLPDAKGPPTFEALLKRLKEKPVDLLYLVVHGIYRGEDGTVLYFPDGNGGVRPVGTDEWIAELQRVPTLPHLVFLASCQSGIAKADRHGHRGNLARRMIEALGIPVVVAMTDVLSVAITPALSGHFFHHLHKTGYPDLALARARDQLMNKHDQPVPALFSRLGTMPLFPPEYRRDLEPDQIRNGLETIREHLPSHAPVLVNSFQSLNHDLTDLLEVESSAGNDPEIRRCLHQVDLICREVFEQSFTQITTHQQPLPALPSPEDFPGFSPFERSQARFFFGRDCDIVALIARLEAEGVLVLTGPSGSGKSSLVRAGLLPRLNWPHRFLDLKKVTPDDMLSHVHQLLEDDTRQDQTPGLLVVDHFERLLTTDQPQTRCRLLMEQLFTHGQRPGSHRLICVNGTFIEACRASGAPDQILSHTYPLQPLRGEALHKAVTSQIKTAGLKTDERLDLTLRRDLMDQSGAMPLVQFLLKELWEKRHGRHLLFEEYQKMGGIARVLQGRVNTFLEHCDGQET